MENNKYDLSLQLAIDIARNLGTTMGDLYFLVFLPYHIF